MAEDCVISGALIYEIPQSCAHPLIALQIDMVAKYNGQGNRPNAMKLKYKFSHIHSKILYTDFILQPYIATKQQC